MYKFSDVSEINTESNIFKRFWSPKNEETSHKLNSMHQRIFGKPYESKERLTNRIPDFHPKSTSSLVSL